MFLCIYYLEKVNRQMDHGHNKHYMDFCVDKFSIHLLFNKNLIYFIFRNILYYFLD